MDTQPQPVPTKPDAPVVAVKADPPAQKTHPVKRGKPAGWFSFSQKGMRPAVVKAVEKSNLPDGFRRSLIEDVASLDASFNYIAIDCHRHLQDGKMVTNCTIKGSAVAAS